MYNLAPMVPSAELRIYQPLHAFPRDEQVRWERWLVSGRNGRPVGHRDLETATGVGFLVPARDGARVIVEDGSTFVSPDGMHLQVLAGVLAVLEDPPFEGAERFVPAAEARRAKRDLARLRRRHAGRMAFAMTSAWNVPPRWFTLFDDSERHLQPSPSLSLTYSTTARKALGRLERAIPILRGADLAPAAEPLLDLYRWIAGVHPRSLVRLDYAGLCDVLRWDELDDDRSARDLWASIDALALGESRRSADLYASVAGRFQELRGRESLN